MTATSVPAEQVFSACGVLVNKLRSALSPSTVDAVWPRMACYSQHVQLYVVNLNVLHQYLLLQLCARTTRKKKTYLSSHNWKQSRQTLTLMLDMKTGSHLILEV